MGVKFSQLPAASTVESDDVLAVLDTSDNILKKCNVDQVGGGKELTQAQYNALTPEEKAHGTYYITDGSAPGSITIDGQMSTTSTNPVANNVLTNAHNQLTSDVGTIESGNLAAYAHAAGEFFMWKGQFVKVTAAIAVGDTIATGTNVASTSVSAVLSELNSKLPNKYYDYITSASSPLVVDCRAMSLITVGRNSTDTGVYFITAVGQVLAIVNSTTHSISWQNSKVTISTTSEDAVGITITQLFSEN